MCTCITLIFKWLNLEEEPDPELLPEPQQRIMSKAGVAGAVLRALCVVCGRCMPVTLAGVIRVHGSLSNWCTGSGMPPSLIATTNTSTPHALPSSSGM